MRLRTEHFGGGARERPRDSGFAKRVAKFGKQESRFQTLTDYEVQRVNDQMFSIWVLW